MGHLHPAICEQWIHRHWTEAPFAFLPIESLSRELILLSTAEIFERIRREFAPNLDPEFDLKHFQKAFDGRKNPTAAALDRGTWDYPIVTLSTPTGIRNFEGERPDVRLVLVEGHQRHRYLNALHAHGLAPEGPHGVFVLRSHITT